LIPAAKQRHFRKFFRLFVGDGILDVPRFCDRLACFYYDFMPYCRGDLGSPALSFSLPSFDKEGKEKTKGLMNNE
jgi:hypothetical protein